MSRFKYTTKEILVSRLIAHLSGDLDKHDLASLEALPSSTKRTLFESVSKFIQLEVLRSAKTDDTKREPHEKNEFQKLLDEI